MGKSFRKERSDWDDFDYGRSGQNRSQKALRKMAKFERDTRQHRRMVDDRVETNEDERG